MSITKYPPRDILKPILSPKDYEYIILWMLQNNDDGCAWSDFLSDPINFSQATLSKYLSFLKNQDPPLVNHAGRGKPYKITEEGVKRYHEILAREESSAQLNYPPQAILDKREYKDWILWMLYNNNSCTWSVFTSEPLSINQSSLSKALNELNEKDNYILKNADREYCITESGEIEYLKMLKKYDLDRQSILEEESKRIEILTEKTSKFLDSYDIEDNEVKYHFLTMILKLDYKSDSETSEEEWNKLFLFLALNHPNKFPKNISIEKFSDAYKIDPITLKYLLTRKIKNKSIYPSEIFELKTNDSKIYYLQEDEKIEKVLRAIVEENITKFQYLNKFHEKSSEKLIKIKNVIKTILDELTVSLFDIKLRGALEKFLPDYINYLAYKIETKKLFKNTGELTVGSFYSELYSGLGSISKNGENEFYYQVHNGIFQALEPYFLSKINFIGEERFKEEFYSKDNIDLLKKIENFVYRGKIDKAEQLYAQSSKQFTAIENIIIQDLLSTVSLDFEKSLKLTSEMILEYPDSYLGYLFRSLTLFKMGDDEEALKVVNEGLESKEDVFLICQKAQIFLINFKFTIIHEILDKALESYPNHPLLLRIKSLLYCQDFACTSRDETIEIIDKAIKSRPNNKELLLIKAINLCYRQKFKQAKRFIKNNWVFNIFNKNYRIDTAVLYILTHAYIARGKFEKALEMTEEFQNQFPDHPLSYLAKALVHGYNLIYEFDKLGSDIKEVQTYIEDALRLENIPYRKGKYYQLKALIYNGLRDYEKAVAEINKASTLDPDNFEFKYNRIMFLLSKKDFDNAIVLIDTYLESNPEHKIDLLQIKSFAYYSKGEIFHDENSEKAKEFHQASLEACDQILSILPDNARALNNKTLNLAAIGNKQEAIKAAERLITLNPNEGNYYDTYGHVLIMFQLYEEAIVRFEKAIEVDPRGFFVYMSYRKIADCYKNIGEYDEAIENAEKAIEIAKKKNLGADIEDFIEETKDFIGELRELKKNERNF
ncbi:MAG: tetratricopeptide repeat protein [Candidatus Hermodarchaeota archaeon]